MSGMPKCPKCRKQTYSLTVTCEEDTHSEVVDGECEFFGACSLPEPVRATAKCKLCGHKWNIRRPGSAQLSSY